MCRHIFSPLQTQLDLLAFTIESNYPLVHLSLKLLKLSYDRTYILRFLFKFGFSQLS